MNHRCVRVLTVLCAALTTLSAAAADLPEAASGAAAGGLGEIVVTAQRRSQNIQSVPISVDAVTNDSLKEAGVTTTDTLTNVIPGLEFNRVARGALPYLRGVGTANTGPGDESSVATYVDGVYYMTSTNNLFSLNNVERVEVLKGPQGTLFGRNAVGGLINVITRDPKAQPSAELSVDHGNFDTWEGNLYATGGSDFIAANFVGYLIRQEDGFGRNLNTGQEVNKRDETNWRAKMLVTPSDLDRIVLDVDYESVKTDFGITRNTLPGSYLLGGFPFRGTAYDSQADQLSKIPFDDAWGTNLRYEHTFSWAKLTALSAYRTFRTNYQYDLDLTPRSYVAVTTFQQRDRSLQDEVLIAGATGPFQYTAGLFQIHMAAATLPLGFTSALIPSQNYVREAQITTDSYAAYMQGTYAIVPSTRLTAGARYTYDKRQLFGDQIASVGYTPGVAPGTVFLTVPETSKSYRVPTWRAAVDQDLAQDVMAYLSYSRGYKSGVFNINNLTQPPLNPETLDAYEIGIKSEWLDHLVRVNMSAFHYNYKNIQIYRFLGSTSQLFNAAAGHINGGELEAVVAPRLPLGNLRVSSGLSVLHAIYASFPEGPVTTPNSPTVGGNSQTSGDDTGKTMVNSPKWTLNVGLDYSVDIGPGQLGVAADFYHNAGFYFTADDRLGQSAYNIVNASAYYGFGPEQHYRLRVWGKNLTNKLFYNYEDENSFGDVAAAALPRLYGVGIDIKF